VKQYSAGHLSIFHVDCYRLNSFQEFLDLDLPLMEKDNVVLIEWGDLIANQDWKESIKIQINEDKKHIREVVVRA
jgi:tRNA A37 threonylcarbamoyladenosine biosynthesis protein TsaE